MKIALAQIRSEAGDIPGNTVLHRQSIQEAKTKGAELVVFPELSLSAYEPEIASTVAVLPDDPMWEGWQELADNHDISFALGMPISVEGGIAIGLVLFRPGQAHCVYAKQYLHPDEEPHFVSEKLWDGHLPEQGLSFAICYELSVPEHAACAAERQAKVYVASVAKFQRHISPTYERLSSIASQYQMYVLMVNGVGEADGEMCAGQSAVWDTKGKLVLHLGEQEENLLLFELN